MTTVETIVLILLLILIIGFIWTITEISDLKRLEKAPPVADPETLKLRLQAYERITLLAERISLHNVLSRTTNDNLTYRQMQRALIETIKQEYEYNISQQVYVSNDMWKAVNKLKEQNIYIINQMAANLSPQASGIDLNKRIIDYIINNPSSQLHNIVLEALNFEAKELM